MIECRGVSFSYDGAALALDGIDLNIEDGEFFCILGGNGSGKSTFAKHLNALLQPDAGTVCVNGLDASDPELVYDIRSTAGMVFQNPDDQLVATLVEDDVAFGPENLGVPSAQIAQRVRDVLKAVGLVGFERHETHALSGGQKQRVALAGVLAMEPRVLILDEASSMLDPRGRKGLMKACHALHERGMTIVMITHFMEEAAEAGNKRAQLASDMLNYQIKKTIGAYIAAMGGVDAIVFTGGIGEHDAAARAKICHHMDWLGIRIDTDKNKHIQGDVCEITAWGAKVRTLVIATDEELMIARDTKEVVEK